MCLNFDMAVREGAENPSYITFLFSLVPIKNFDGGNTSITDSFNDDFASASAI